MSVIGRAVGSSTVSQMKLENAMLLVMVSDSLGFITHSLFSQYIKSNVADACGKAGQGCDLQ